MRVMVPSVDKTPCDLLVAREDSAPKSSVQIEVALLTGGTDRHYTFGLAMDLVTQGVHLDIIGSDEVDSPEMHDTPGLDFFNMVRSQRSDASLANKLSRVSAYYARLIGYAWKARPKIFHILWNNRFQFFDRTLLMFYYKFLGKKIAFTAHNVNEARRDGRDSWLNRVSLRVQYRLADHIFVHTEKMKAELLADFGVEEKSVTIIPYGINNALPSSNLTHAEAKRKLNIGGDEKTILFFGNIRPSKGLEYLLKALDLLAAHDTHYRLVIAGRRIKEFESYWESIQPILRRHQDRGLVMLRDEFIPDEEIEIYFKAADVLALPYTEIFQSGVLFMGYSFGLPVIAADVGSFREDVVEGRTGFLCNAREPIDIARTIETYFESDLFKNLGNRRLEIQDYARAEHSWGLVAETTRNVYASLLGESPL
jgi:glycosyltransferase involved in cell wall biosynthesis